MLPDVANTCLLRDLRYVMWFSIFLSCLPSLSIASLPPFFPLTSRSLRISVAVVNGEDS